MLRDYHRKYLSKKGSGGREVHRTATEKTADFSRGRHLSPRKTTSDDEHKNIILMTRHYPGLGSAYDWLKRNSLAFQPIRSTTYIWVVTRHQHGIFAFHMHRRRFARGQVATSRNVGCFLRLSQITICPVYKSK